MTFGADSGKLACASREQPAAHCISFYTSFRRAYRSGQTERALMVIILQLGPAISGAHERLNGAGRGSSTPQARSTSPTWSIPLLVRQAPCTGGYVSSTAHSVESVRSASDRLPGWW